MAIEFRSSVAATSCKSRILHKDFETAKQILKEDGIFKESFEDAWNYIVSIFSGGKLNLKKVEKADVKENQLYLFRVGSEVFLETTKRGFYRTDLQETVFFTRDDMFTLDEIDEFVEVRLS